MKEKEKTLSNKEQNSEMINSNIFDDLFANLPHENDNINDEAEKEDSLFSEETSSLEENSSDNSLEIAFQVGEASDNTSSKLTIADAFNISTEEDFLSEKEDTNLTIDSVFGKEEVLKEKEDTISNIQKQLPSITITENTGDEENVILKPIASIQDQLPPITITNDDEITERKEESNNTNLGGIIAPTQTIESIFATEKVEETNPEIDSNIQIGLDDEADSFFEEDSILPMEKIEEENSTSNENHSEIDYFQYDFKNDIKENTANQSNSTEDQFSFDFYNTIRPQEESQEPNPSQEKVEFSKVFAQKIRVRMMTKLL